MQKNVHLPRTEIDGAYSFGAQCIFLFRANVCILTQSVYQWLNIYRAAGSFFFVLMHWLVVFYQCAYFVLFVSPNKGIYKWMTGEWCIVILKCTRMSCVFVSACVRLRAGTKCFHPSNLYLMYSLIPVSFKRKWKMQKNAKCQTFEEKVQFKKWLAHF